MLALVLSLIPLLLYIPNFPLLSLVSYLTNWIMCLTVLTCTLVLLFANDPKINRKKWHLAILHQCFQFNFVFSYCFLIYWFTIHAYRPAHLRATIWTEMYCLTAHTFPMVSLLLIYSTMEIKVVGSQWYWVIPVHIFYAIVNFGFTKRNGYPLYWFLTW